jgi:hypothetical protein
MNIVDRFSLPVSKHRLEDILYPVLTGPQMKTYKKSVIRNKKNIGDEKNTIYNVILRFAHRMNFNTKALGL